MRAAPFGRTGAVLVVLAAAIAALVGAARAASVVAQEGATPTPYSCATVQATPGTEAAGGMAGMDMGTPPSGMDMAMEFDQMYIDMMIPHHRSIMALAQAALDRLEDERLRRIAEDIVATQGPEIEELRGYREQFYGSPDPLPMDEQMMGMLQQMVPGMTGSPEEMAVEMDPEAQVAAFCAAEDPDLAFIDMVIPHHSSAIAVSEAALDQAVRDEIKDVARRVIEAQQREIDELEGIRAELYGAATPVA